MDGPLLHLVLRTSKNVQGGTTMSAQDIIKSIEDAQLREVAEFKTGDTVRVHAKVKEGNRERIQVFEGTGKPKGSGAYGTGWYFASKGTLSSVSVAVLRRNASEMRYGDCSGSRSGYFIRG